MSSKQSKFIYSIDGCRSKMNNFYVHALLSFAQIHKYRKNYNSLAGFVHQ